MALVSLAKYKRAIGETDGANDTLHTEALDDASQAVLDWTDRDFGVTPVVATRSYPYDGSGFLEIDDATTINSVTFAGAVITPPRYKARSEGPALTYGVVSYLELPPFSTESGEMGFMNNLDVYLTRYGPVYREVDVVINAAWGFTPVPGSVERAVIITAAAYEADEGRSAVGLAAKSVAEVAESYVQSEAAGRAGDDPLPKRAQSLLAPYRRHVL